jgi:hypothetical protein
MSLKELRAAIRRQQVRRSHQGARYSADVQQAVREFTRAQRSRGFSCGSIAGEIGLPINTLQRWCARELRAGALAPVEILEERVPERMVFVSASGHRVEGLSLESLAFLLERLS